MDRQEMLDRLANGESPLDVSIQKWKDIVSDLERGEFLDKINISQKTCALCHIYFSEDSPIGEDCNNCPYRIHYGYECYDFDTAYDNFYFELLHSNKEKAIFYAGEMVKELEAIKNHT